MFFNRKSKHPQLATLKKTILFLSLIFGLSACDRFLKNDDKSSQTQDSVKIEFKEGACLKEVPAQLGKFFKDQSPLSPSTICVNKALKSFLELTRGADARQYTAKELKDFFNDYLLQENKIDDDFLKDIMMIKMVISGGIPEIATREELQNFMQFLFEFGILGDDLQGMMQIVTLKAPLDSVDLIRLQDFKVKITKVADFVLAKSKLTESKYQINDLNLFLEHLRKFISGTRMNSSSGSGATDGPVVPGHVDELEDLFKWLPLINMTRELLIGDAARLQTQKDWVETKDWLVGSYLTFLKYHFVIRQQSFVTPEDSSLLVSFLDEIFSILEKSPLLREKKIFDAGKVDALIDELVKQKLLVIDLPIPLLKESYRKALVYFIDSVAAPQDLGKFRGITESQIMSLKAEYNIWKASQNLLIRSFRELNSTPTLRTLLNFQKTIDGKGFPLVPVNDREEYNRAWWDFYALLNRPFPLLHDEELRMLVRPIRADEALSFRGLTQTNFIRTIARMVLRGYGNHEERAIYKRVITEEGFIRLESDFHQFAVQTGLVDPDKTTSGQETFDQGKMLVFSSNGNSVIDATETTELFATLFSGGKTILNLIYTDLKASACAIPENDVFGLPWVNESCFYAQLRSKVSQYFPNIPLFSQFIRGVPDGQFAAWYQSALKAAKSIRHRQGLLESGEIRTMAAIFHFVDEIYLTYDLNKNGVLSEAEVRRAYPRFQDVIVKEAEKKGYLATLIPDSIFMYLVYNGEIPDSMDIFSHWAEQWTVGLGDVDRLKIFKLLGTMKEVLDQENMKKNLKPLEKSASLVPALGTTQKVSSAHFGQVPKDQKAPLDFLGKTGQYKDKADVKAKALTQSADADSPEANSVDAKSAEPKGQQGNDEPNFFQRVYKKASAFIKSYFAGL